jgi:hypothetical protein
MEDAFMSTLTYEVFGTMMGACEARFGSAPAAPAAMQIVESRECVRKTNDPARPHKRPRWMSAAYHRRVQKKWLKRWGYRQEPCAYKIDPRAPAQLGEPYLVTHPRLAAKLCEQLRAM